MNDKARSAAIMGKRTDRARKRLLALNRAGLGWREIAAQEAPGVHYSVVHKLAVLGIPPADPDKLRALGLPAICPTCGRRKPAPRSPRAPTDSDALDPRVWYWRKGVGEWLGLTAGAEYRARVQWKREGGLVRSAWAVWGHAQKDGDPPVYCSSCADSSESRAQVEALPLPARSRKLKNI